MPQENQVLRCYHCKMFQVHLVKKVKKWQCKLCNNKQSVKQIYGKGSGKDCRLHVMKLNELQFSGSDVHYSANDKVPISEIETKAVKTMDMKTESKWLKYIDGDNEIADEEEEVNCKITEKNNQKRRKLSGEYVNEGKNLSFEFKQNNNKDFEKESSNEQIIEGCCSKSKWPAYSDNELYVPKEKLSKNIHKSDYIKPLTHQELFKDKLTESDNDTSSKYKKYSEDIQIPQVKITHRKKDNLKFLETIIDESDLDEILNF